MDSKYQHHKLIVVILILNPSKYLFSMSKSTKRTTIVGANIILVPGTNT